ncbi:hypothetical protein BCR39DRAFT_366752 [Naematelia encephala]|uniref:Nucleolus and neural progenitor protein-like N-terminal domain-containing protein n=1 Tax=Naematelia encephala TaxID=71784 RepID=A0A1Y2AK73_9TREE|nr:hypothetical protein BCR39DRAFT_366752 [Naematelia encephala]
MAIHSSVNAHLEIELSALIAIRRHSMHQHRSQVFLQRLRAVERAGKILQRSLATGSPRLDLLHKMSTVILIASKASLRIIDLNYFLPLHTLLVAIYARLFAIVTSVLAEAEASTIAPESATHAITVTPKAEARIENKPSTFSGSSGNADRSLQDSSNVQNRLSPPEPAKLPNDSSVKPLQPQGRLKKRRKNEIDDIFA